MQLDEVIDDLREFIAREILAGDGAELDAETPLLAWGILDSLTLVTLLDHLERRFGIRIPPSEATPDQLETIRAVAELVVRLAAGMEEGAL